MRIQGVKGTGVEFIDNKPLLDMFLQRPLGLISAFLKGQRNFTGYLRRFYRLAYFFNNGLNTYHASQFHLKQNVFFQDSLRYWTRKVSFPRAAMFRWSTNSRRISRNINILSRRARKTMLILRFIILRGM